MFSALMFVSRVEHCFQRLPPRSFIGTDSCFLSGLAAAAACGNTEHVLQLLNSVCCCWVCIEEHWLVWLDIVKWIARLGMSVLRLMFTSCDFYRRFRGSRVTSYHVCFSSEIDSVGGCEGREGASVCTNKHASVSHSPSFSLSLSLFLSDRYFSAV